MISIDDKKKKLGLLKFELLACGMRIDKTAYDKLVGYKNPIRTRSGASGGLDIKLPENIYVNVPETANGDIIVFNMMGQEMVRTDIAPGLNVIPMENVNTYYVVKVLTSNSAVTGKVYIK